MVDVYIGGHL